jgi:hypothetical protein
LIGRLTDHRLARLFIPHSSFSHASMNISTL